MALRKKSTSAVLRNLNYKTSHSDPEFKTATFLQKKIIDRIAYDNYRVNCRTLPRGINEKKKNDIIEKLGPLMKPSCVQFYKDLLSMEDLPDMLSSY